MENARDPREHINETPANDLLATVRGFGWTFVAFFVVFIVAIVIKYNIS
jgi:hypothetical protein